ncbi:MAG: 50S ribosomal protein L31e [Candidatus Hadarchaeales archaeon]
MDMAEEKIYIIPLSEVKKAPEYKRAKKAVNLVRDFLVRHTKEPEIKLDRTVTEKIWERGSKKPPTKIKVKVTKKDDETVGASLAE